MVVFIEEELALNVDVRSMTSLKQDDVIIWSY